MTPEPDARDFAERTIVGWHVLFGAMVLAAAVFLGIDGHLGVALVGLAVLVAAYLLLIVRGMYALTPARAWAYLFVAYAVVCVLTWVDPNALVLLFGVYPQAFLILERRGSIVATVVLTVAWSLVLVAKDGWSAASWGTHAFTAVGNVVFALVIGLFIEGLVRESRERKRLLAELREAQDELAAAEREAGALEERERLARDIHDTLAQGFTSIVMLAQAGEAAADRADMDTSKRRFTEIQETARDNLAEARALVGALAPPPLAEAGLPDSLTRIVGRFGTETGTAAQITVAGPVRPLASSSEVVALRATQECLSNVRRHASAGHVDVVLEYDEDGATVTVRDDGRGFEADGTAHGYGLEGLRARVEGVGGVMAVDSAPGTGTTVRVRVP